MEAKVLLVEDNKGLSLLFSKILERNNYEVISSENGAEAFSVLATDKEFDVILLDIMMPELDGIGLLKKGKDIFKEKQIKICMLSALSDMEKIQECLSLGADDYIVKIADEELLVNKIRFLSGQLPKYKYSSIECEHVESILIGSEKIDATVIEIHEDYFVFKTESEIKEGAKLKISNGEIWNMMGMSRDILARIFSVDQDSNKFKAFANYIGLSEGQIKSLRSKTVRGG